MTPHRRRKLTACDRRLRRNARATLRLVCGAQRPRLVRNSLGGLVVDRIGVGGPAVLFGFESKAYFEVTTG